MGIMWRVLVVLLMYSIVCLLMFAKVSHLMSKSFPRNTSIDMTLTTRNSVFMVWKLLCVSLKLIGIIAIVASSLSISPFAVLIFKGLLLLIYISQNTSPLRNRKKSKKRESL